MGPPLEAMRVFSGEFDTGDRAHIGPLAGQPVRPELSRCEEKESSGPGEPEDPWPARRIALRREYGGHENQGRVLREDAARRADRE